MAETEFHSTWSDVKEVIERKLKENNVPDDAKITQDTIHPNRSYIWRASDD